MRGRWGAVVVVGVALLALAGAAGCDGRTAVAPDPQGPLPSGVAPEAVTRWAQFPADRAPRPVVLLDELPLSSGFSDGSTQDAFRYGRYLLTTQEPLPQAPAKTVTVTLPGQPAVQLPAIGAQEAFVALRNVKPRNVASDAAEPTGVVRIIAVTFGSAMFRTDRGDASLPAWVFTVEGSSGPVLWPALAADGYVKAPTKIQAPPLGPATARGSTVTIRLEAPEPACPGQPEHRYEPVVVESPRVVAIGLRAVVSGTAPGPANDSCGHVAMLRTAEYEMRLAAPLGARLLVGADGIPIQVNQV
ncbi:hypothetical protein [Dactylosporangium fulvum]|uniref:GerMN domain-containing protein n=1 Tax=Dactylosporangium fulvum TaxID=53359 RepID=A0ABY5W8Q4_9ACTN|nr:hypothetical protein [Dactylosporangium fulvum]UWP85594.1 hypothetical protein Dfulv_15655 [Dactylosporangium fulvum]